MKLPWNFNVHPAQRNMKHHFVYVSVRTSNEYCVISIVASILMRFIFSLRFYFLSLFFRMENRVRPNFEYFIQRYWTTEKKGKKKYGMIDHNERKRKNKSHTKMYRRSIGRLIVRFRRSRYNKKTHAKVKDNIYTCYLNVNKICKCNDDRLLYARMQARNKRIPN